MGIEDASPESIRKALDKVRILYQESSHEFHMEDLWNSGLTGAEDATGKRASVGAILGIGYGECQAVFAQAESFWDYTKGVGIRVGRVREKV